MKKFSEKMKGIRSSAVNKNKSTNKALMNYKPYKGVINYLADTVKISQKIKSVYDFKSTE